MRKIILNRIEELAAVNDNFPKTTMRWKNFAVNTDRGLYHISEISYDWLTDEELLKLFERMIKTHYTQM